jgi:lipopolysaccharide export system protein LptA
MHVFYVKATKKKKGGIEKIVAMRNVKIRQHPNTANADKAVYVLSENTITLTGTEKERPHLIGEDGQRMTADVFVVDKLTGDVSGQNISIEAVTTQGEEEESP